MKARKSVYTGWAIRDWYQFKKSAALRCYLLGRWHFDSKQQIHMSGYRVGTFATRRQARDWLRNYKSKTDNAYWRSRCRRMSVVKVQITVEEMT